jgi:tetratricopeptide (TPR) repeat protein
MRSGLVVLCALVAGAAGGFAAAHVRPTDAPEDRPTTTDAAPELRRIERRVDELAAAVRARGAVAATPAGGPAGADAPPGAAAETHAVSSDDRLAAIERRLAALEKGGGAQGPSVPENLARVATKELDALGRTLVQAKRYDEAQRILKEVVGRTDLDEEQRIEAEMQLGYALRGAGKFADAEARFAETLRRVGEDTAKGAWLGFQIAWDRYYQKDLAGASARMERSANAAGVDAIVRVHALYNAANFAKEAGDATRARALLERLLDRHAGDIPPAQAFMKTQADAWLKELRGY